VYDYGRRRADYTPFILGVFAVLLAFGALQLLRGTPQPSLAVTFPDTSPLGDAVKPALPEAGSSIIAVDGLGTLAVAGPAQPRPIASITKMMTAYVILKNHPLQPGQPGPIIELTTRDAARWLEMVAQDQSSLPVTAGQRLNQLQLLQGLLVPSANNYAEILANWDAGSVAAFVLKMNAEAQALGMANTRYADASGFSASSVSTPADQLILARAAMQDPVFAGIVRLETVNIPGVGLTHAVNQLLGEDGVIGIKTGFTEEAGGNLAFAARRQVDGEEVSITGIVLGQPDRPAAFTATRQALDSLDGNLALKPVLAAGQPIAEVDTPWGQPVNLVINEDVRLLIWPGTLMTTSVEIEKLTAPMKAGEQAGWLNVAVGEQTRRVPLVLAGNLDGAGLLWRLTHF
jgi:D-alanyl-D-alanine carboxypeptidase (penicillin-binding protein 5/6)